jgi:hypothetical protein
MFLQRFVYQSLHFSYSGSQIKHFDDECVGHTAVHRELFDSAINVVLRPNFSSPGIAGLVST